MKCGYIALLGQPNAGKSTLLNALVGQKLAGVSKRAQTTRNRILGIRLEEAQEAQMIFLDTPGIHQDQRLVEMNRMMNQEAWAVSAQADVVCYLVDLTQDWSKLDGEYLRRIAEALGSRTLYVLLTKTDSIKKEEVRERRRVIKEHLNGIFEPFGDKLVRVIMDISAKRPEEVAALASKLALRLPEGPWLFEADDLSDRPERFFISEYIREQAFRLLGKELPYGIGVTVDEVNDSGKSVHVMATIIVSRESHKGIVIGKQGSMIKQIGTEARKTLEQYFEKKVNLELFVSAKEGWTERRDLVNQIQDLDLD